jgi:hypothetical protein
LTRRANHRHIFIIAKVMQSPGGEIRSGLFCCSFRWRPHDGVNENNINGKRYEDPVLRGLIYRQAAQTGQVSVNRPAQNILKSST